MLALWSLQLIEPSALALFLLFCIDKRMSAFGGKTWPIAVQMSAYDPKRTCARLAYRHARRGFRNRSLFELCANPVLSLPPISDDRRTFNRADKMSAFGGKADMAYCSANVRL
jgi:hypothetical protein